MPPQSMTHLVRSAFCTVAIAVALGLCTIIVRPAIQLDIIAPQDEGILLVYPDLILRGYRPYSDFAALYSPGGFYFLAGMFKVFGSSVIVERCAGLLYWYLVMVALFLLGSRVGRVTGTLAVITALAYSSLYQSPGAHPHFAAFACMLFALFCASSDTTSNTSFAKAVPLLAGVLAGTTFWIKQDLGVVAVLGTLASFAFGSPNPRKYFQLLTFLLGLSIPACGLVIFALLVGPASVIDSLVLDPLRSAPGRVLPLTPSLDLIVVIVCVTVQLYGAAIARNPTVPEYLVRLSRGIATATVFFALSLLHRFGVGDISWVGSIMVSLTVISVRITLTHLRFGQQRAAVVVASCLLIGLLPVFVRHFTDPPEHPPISSVLSRGRTVPWVPNDIGLQDLLVDINRRSSPGDKLFVGPTDLRFAISNTTFLYYLLPQLVPATRYLEMNPGCANRSGSGLADQIVRADWLILTPEYNRAFEPNASDIPGPSAPNDIVRANFCVLSQHSPWLLLHRCG